MSSIPEEVETDRLIGGHYEVRRPDQEIIDELVYTVNEIIKYLETAPTEYQDKEEEE